jgi:hypothetical protein
MPARKKQTRSPDSVPHLEQHTEAIFWFVVLCGFIPAMLARTLFPFDWIASFSKPPELLPVVGTTPQMIFGVLLLIGLSLCVLHRRYWRLLLLLPLVLLMLVSFSEDSKLFKPAHMAYGGTSFAVFAYHFLLNKHAHIRNLPFLAYVLLLILLLLSIPAFGLYQLVVFVFIAIVLHMLHLFWMQNFRFFKKLRFKKTLHLGMKSLLLWAPILLFLIPGHMLYQYLSRASENFLYERTLLTHVDKKRGPDGRIRRTTTEAVGRGIVERDLEKDLSVSISRQLVVEDKKLEKELKALERASKKNAKQVPDKATDLVFDSLPPDPLLEPDRCRFMDIPCYTGNSIKEGVNRAYRSAYNEQKRSLRNVLRDEAKKTNNDVKAVINLARREKKETFKKIERSLNVLIANVFDAFTLLVLSLNFLLILAVIKSYMYVFARVAFARGTEASIAFCDPELAIKKGKVNKKGSKYIVGKRTKKDFFFSRRYHPRGHAQRISLPNWGAAILSRILTRTYVMNRAKLANTETGIQFETVATNEFVEWELGPDEIVFFDFKNLVGMGDSVRFRTEISLRLPTLLMGRMIFHCATGPGKLVLRTHKPAAISGDPYSRLSTPVHRFVAWHAKTCFDVDAEGNVLDIFLSSVNLKKHSGDLVVINADIPTTVAGGIIRFIKSFLLPI